MKIEFDFDPDNLERAVLDAATEGLKQMANDYTREYKRLARLHNGGDVDAAKRDLQAFHRRHDGHITDPELTEYAQAIVAGAEIVFEFDARDLG